LQAFLIGTQNNNQIENSYIFQESTNLFIKYFIVFNKKN
jgi:hypothetical protein